MIIWFTEKGLTELAFQVSGMLRLILKNFQGKKQSPTLTLAKKLVTCR